MTPASSPQDDGAIAEIISAHAHLEGPLLPMLHALQEEFGVIPEAAHAPLCKALTITRAELKGVISFYHDFREKPAGKHVLKICRAEACQSMGGRFSTHVCQRLSTTARHFCHTHL